MAEGYQLNPALCLDFDGTIRTSRRGKFIDQVDDIVLFPDVEPLLWEYRSKGFVILGITNQGGVAFGYKTLQQNQDEIDATLALFERNPFDAVQVSVLHPEGSVSPFNHRSLLRKPAMGMLAVCEADLFRKGIIIDWDQSIFVGDRPEDEECARRAQVAFTHADVFFNRLPSPTEENG